MEQETHHKTNQFVPDAGNASLSVNEKINRTADFAQNVEKHSKCNY